jgi:hypothetical protein
MSAPGKRKSEQLVAPKPAPVVPAEAEADDSGRARKSARSRGVSVKLTGAGSCKQQEAAEPGSGNADDTDMPPAADAPMVASGGGGGGKFDVGDTIILLNGSLCYEADVLQVQGADAPAATKKGTKKAEPAPAATRSYLVRYTKWPRRPEEWVAEMFVNEWSEALAKGATNRPPRARMWDAKKAGGAKGGAAGADDEEELDEEDEPAPKPAPKVDGGAAPKVEDKAEGRRSGRGPKPSTAVNETGADEAGSKRQRKSNDKAEEVKEEKAAGKGVGAVRGAAAGGGGRAAARSVTPFSDGEGGESTMAVHADEDANALMDLFGGGGGKKDPKTLKEEGEEEDDDMNDDEEEGEDDDNEEEDGEDGEEDEDEDEEEEEEEEANDDREGEAEVDDDEEEEEVEDDLKLILAQQKQKDKKDANLLKEQEAAQLEIKSPRAEAKKAMEDARRKHRRKGLPMKSLPAPREIDLAARTLEGEGDPKAALSDERPPSSAATTKDTSGVARVRRRKPAKPCASLLPMW